MTIHPKVVHAARQFGGDSVWLPRLVQAMVNAEGGIERILPAVRCRFPATDTVDEALIITCRSAVHWLADYTLAHDMPGYVAELGEHWAPYPAKNDPKGLNKNWIPNVVKLLAEWLT